MDEISIWNATAIGSEVPIDSVSFAYPYRGTSFWFDRDFLCSEFGACHVWGQCGALRAAQGNDLGSPGWTKWTQPQLIDINFHGGNTSLTWKAQPGSSIQIQHSENLSSSWNPIPGSRSASSTINSAILPEPPGFLQRYFRLETLAPAVCNCP